MVNTTDSCVTKGCQKLLLLLMMCLVNCPGACINAFLGWSLFFEDVGKVFRWAVQVQMDAGFCRHLRVGYLICGSVILSEVVLQSHSYYQVRHWGSIALVPRALYKGRDGSSFTRRRWLLSNEIGLALRLCIINVIASQVPFYRTSWDKELVISVIDYIPSVYVSRGQVGGDLDSWHHFVLIAFVLLGPVLSISLVVSTGCRYYTVTVATSAPVRIQASFFELKVIGLIRLMPI